MKCTEYKTRREVADLVFTIKQLFINRFNASLYSGFYRVHILLNIFIIEIICQVQQKFRIKPGMTHLIGWIACDYILSLHAMECEMNIAKTHFQSGGQCGVDSVGIGWNLSRHESHQMTFVNSNTIKRLKNGQKDAGFNVPITDTAFCGQSIVS